MSENSNPFAAAVFAIVVGLCISAGVIAFVRTCIRDGGETAKTEQAEKPVKSCVTQTKDRLKQWRTLGGIFPEPNLGDAIWCKPDNSKVDVLWYNPDDCKSRDPINIDYVVNTEFNYSEAVEITRGFYRGFQGYVDGHKSGIYSVWIDTSRRPIKSPEPRRSGLGMRRFTGIPASSLKSIDESARESVDDLYPSPIEATE